MDDCNQSDKDPHVEKCVAARDSKTAKWLSKNKRCLFSSSSSGVEKRKKKERQKSRNGKTTQTWQDR